MKASDILDIGKIRTPKEDSFFINGRDPDFYKNKFTTQKEAQNLLDLWDSADELKAENDRLKSELEDAKKYIQELIYEIKSLNNQPDF